MKDLNTLTDSPAARRALCVLACLAMAACAPMEPRTGPAAVRPCKDTGSANQPIRLGYVDGVPEFLNQQKCAGDSNNPLPDPPDVNGNVCTDRNKKPDLRFILTGTLANDYDLVGVQLGGSATGPGSLPAGAFYDFDFDSFSDFLSGTPEVTINGATMHLENRNCLAFEAHYWVVMRHKASGDEKVFHPIIVNQGSEPY